MPASFTRGAASAGYAGGDPEKNSVSPLSDRNASTVLRSGYTSLDIRTGAPNGAPAPDRVARNVSYLTDVACVDDSGMTRPCWPGGRGMSSAAVFRAMTLTGVDHAERRFGRVDIQMSVEPTPPGRSDPNHSVSPSAEIAALVSNVAVFTSFTGSGLPNGRFVS
jgi:hypothetical protein